MPADRIIDGKSVLPLLRGESTTVFDNRSLFFYWTRQYPQLYSNIALQRGPWRLIGNTRYNASAEEFELFDFREDAFEQQNIVASNRSKAVEMKDELDRMIDEITSSEHLRNAQRIIIGTAQENPVFLNRNDALGSQGVWNQEDVYGFWKVKIHEGRYNIRIHFIKSLDADGMMFIETNSFIVRSETIDSPTDVIELKDVSLSDMACDFTPYYSVKGKRYFPLWVELEKMD